MTNDDHFSCELFPDILALLKEYAAADECTIDGAPDANNSGHDCSFCRAQTLLYRIDKENEQVPGRKRE